MIKGILIINNYGKPRLCKFYESVTGENEQQNVIRRIFQQVIKRSDSFCNYLEVFYPLITYIIYDVYDILVFIGKYP